MTTGLAFWDRLSEQVAAGRFVPAADNVLVRVDPDQGDLGPDSLIVAPDTLTRPHAQSLLGTVIAVGPGHYPEVRTMPARPLRHGTEETSPVIHRQFIPTEVKVGDRVALSSQLSGERWPLRSGEHRLVREAEIMAVIEWGEEDALMDLAPDTLPGAA